MWFETLLLSPSKNGTNLDHYKCSKYSKIVDQCINPHYILKVNLEEIILAKLNKRNSIMNIEIHYDFIGSLNKKSE